MPNDKTSPLDNKSLGRSVTGFMLAKLLARLTREWRGELTALEVRIAALEAAAEPAPQPPEKQQRRMLVRGGKVVPV